MLCRAPPPQPTKLVDSLLQRPSTTSKRSFTSRSHRHSAFPSPISYGPPSPAPQLVRSLLQSFRRQLADASAADVASLLWALRFVTQPYTQLVVRLHRRWAGGKGVTTERQSNCAGNGQPGDSEAGGVKQPGIAGRALPGERSAEQVSLTQPRHFAPSVAMDYARSASRRTLLWVQFIATSSLCFDCLSCLACRTASRGWTYLTSQAHGLLNLGKRPATTGNALKRAITAPYGIAAIPLHYTSALAACRATTVRHIARPSAQTALNLPSSPPPSPGCSETWLRPCCPPSRPPQPQPPPTPSQIANMHRPQHSAPPRTIVLHP